VPLTGQTVYEYYTAKDFPVVTDETQMNPHHHSKPPAIPPFPSPMSCNLEFMKVSQGYSIQLNDMHGKQKAITYFGQAKDGKLIDIPVSKVEYKYLSKPKVVNGILSNVLVNDVETMAQDGIETIKRSMGLHEELFADSRLSQDYTFSAGVDINVEVDIFIYPPVFVSIPIPIPMPTINASYGEIRSIVTNKLITRTGILSETIATDGTSTISTKNEVYDALTGQPILSSINNNFNKPVYDYKIPAHWVYKQMGPAYQNLEIEYKGTQSPPVTELISGTDHYDFTVANSAVPMLIKGDELLVTIGSHKNLKAVVSDIGSSNTTIHLVNNFNAAITGSCSIKVIRSGNRNILSAVAANYKTLEHSPIENRTSATCTPDAYLPLDGEVCDVINNNAINADISLLINGIFNSSFTTSIATNFNSSFTHTGDSYTAVINLPSGGSIALNSLSQFYNSIKVTLTENLAPIGYSGCNKECVINEIKFEFNPKCASCESSMIKFYTKTKVFGADPPATHHLWRGKNFLKFSEENMGCAQNCIKSLQPQGWVSENGIDGLYYFSIDLKGCHTVSTTSCGINNLQLNLINNVLSASTTTFEDFWPQDFHALNYSQRDVLSDKLKSNKYLDGELGIWRSRQNFIYQEERKQTKKSGSVTPDVKLVSDGTFDNVPLFQFNNPYFANCSASQKWKPVSTVTKYSPFNYEVENRDVLGIHSAALYAYNGKLNTAIAGNAKEEEVGFTSFEDYVSNTNGYICYTSLTDNIRFPNLLHDANERTDDNDISTPVVKKYQDEFDILRGVGNQILIRKIFNSADNFTDVIVSAIKPSTGETVVLEGTATQADENGYTILTLSKTPDFPSGKGTPSECFGGRLFIKRECQFDIVQNNSTVVETESHSGSKSLKIISNTIFNQGDLRLTPGKKYILSCWMKGNSLKPEALLGSLSNTSSIEVKAQGIAYSIYPKGEIIDGWQKFEGIFEVPGDFIPGNLSIEFKLGDQAYLFVDDIRVSPSEGSMKTFVYNADNFKLCSVLDDNNYGTFYYYNEKGNLFLIKRETPKGKMTVNETRSFMKTEGE
jgi:hypothetical protein